MRGGITVNPLVGWRVKDKGLIHHYCEAYTITQGRKGCSVSIYLDRCGEELGFFGDLEAAKGFVNGHYSRRIRGAIKGDNT